MKIKTLFISILAILLLSGCGAKQEPAGSTEMATVQQTFHWKLVTTWPKNYPGLGMAPEKLARMVDTMSAGRLKIKVYGAGQVVPAFEVFDAVSSGTVQMGHGAAYYWKGKAPASVLFTAYPFGLNAQEINSWLHNGGGLELWREVYAPFNLVPFAGGNTGVQMGGWYNREINSLGDLKGLKIRMPGLGGEVISRAGAEAVNIPGNELYTALQTGVVDATEWVGPSNDMAFGFHQIAKYYYYPGWHEPGAELEFIVNDSALTTLPADLQAILEAAMRAVNADMLDEYTANNNKALETLVNEHGVEVRQFPAEVLTELKRISAEILQEQAAADPVFAKVFTSVKAFEKQVQAYHKISEQAMYDIR